LTAERVARRLAAILAADVVGYSRLMGRDEAGTLARLRALRRELIDPKVAEHKGRIVKTTGDGILAEFPSVVEAVACAVAVQRGMAERDGGTPDDRIEYRMGIHVGDVIVEDGDIFGDGVNVAARLEGMADPGAVFVSARVQEDTVGRLGLTFEDLGERSLKNIDRPVRVYRVNAGKGVARVPKPMAEPIAERLLFPERPSIAVLAFTNMSSDPDQEFFADGVSEDIITDLSRNRVLFVIARNSSFSYKGRTVDVKQISRELGVRYLVQGSVRRIGSRARVTVQLIDAETGNHIWAERYDRDVGEVFAVQDEIARAVASAIVPAVADMEQQRALRKPPENLGAWEAYQRGLWHVTRMGKEDNEKSQRLFQRAIDLDPAFSLAYQGLARAHVDKASHHMSLSAADAFAVALPLALKAVELDPADANAHGLLGYVWLINGDLEQGLARAIMALDMNTNSVVALQTKGSCLVFLGKLGEGAHVLREYLRLNPRDPWSFRAYTHLSIACYALTDYEGCVDAGQRAVQANPKINGSYRWLAAALAQLGRIDEALQVIRRASDILAPVTFTDYVLYRGPWLSKAEHEHMLEGLRKAGWNG
jgi:adenylate cyclase